QPTGPHQPLDPPATDPAPFGGEGPLEPWTAIRSATSPENRFHHLEQSPVLFPARTLGSLTPRVVAGACHAVERAQTRQAHRTLVRVDERERLALCSEQNRMAFFRRACSS